LLAEDLANAAHLVAAAVADHDEEGAVICLDSIGDERWDTGVELLPHGGELVWRESTMNASNDFMATMIP
jgi:hypothetical protein